MSYEEQRTWNRRVRLHEQVQEILEIPDGQEQMSYYEGIAMVFAQSFIDSTLAEPFSPDYLAQISI